MTVRQSVSAQQHEPKKNVYISLEHKEREFLSKLLLTTYFADAGFRVILGSSEAVETAAMAGSPGIFLHKSMHPRAESIRRAGHYFVILDEEGGVTTPRSSYADFCRSRYATLSPKNADLLLLPSQGFLNEINKLPNAAAIPMEVTGWPRIDLWRNQFRAVLSGESAIISRRHGKFFLVLSSFGATSPQGFRKLVEFESPSAHFRSIQEHKRESFPNYVDLIGSMSLNLRPDESIVVRPHPSESVAEWQKVLSGLQGVSVVRDGDPGPWIDACMGVVHFGSTTVTQSVLANKPSVSYKVRNAIGITDSPSFELIPNVHSTGEVLSILRGNEKKKVLMERRAQAEKILKTYMDFDEGITACAKVVARIQALTPTKSFAPDLKLSAKVAIWNLHFLSRTKAWLRKQGIIRFEGKTISENLPGGVESEEVTRLLGRFDALRQIERQWRVKQMAPYLVMIEASP